MTRSVTIEGDKQLIAALKKLGEEAERYVDDAVNATGLELRGDIIKRYQRGPASGITYTRGSVSHTASRAGEAPATDTGRLASSVTFTNTGKGSAEVSTDVEYGAMLEFGTQAIEPRPAWRPAAQEMEPKYQRRLEAALAKATKT
jgi:HK97 gp10 family phage protein